MDLSPGRAALEACLPDLGTPQRLEGLSAPVEVFRDRWGIPHIRAACEADLFFAQGFATAQDRLWQMDADRHRALGRWAEWVGPPGLDRDRLLRAAGMGRTAQLDYEVCSAEARAMLDAYTAGVNAWLGCGAPLPIEYQLLEETPEPWEPWHCLAVYKVRNSLLGTFEPKLLRTRLAAQIGAEATARMVRGTPPGSLLTVPPAAEYDGAPLQGEPVLRRAVAALEEAGADPTLLLPGVGFDADGGSNAWALGGERTASGDPMVAGDSHRGLDVPNVYQQVHLSCPAFTVLGHAVAGVPGALHFCHNEHVAWGMTHGLADTQDLFLERFREGGIGGRQVLCPEGEWRAALVLSESLRVRGAESVDLEVTITHHGPVICGAPAAGWGIAICDPGLIEGTAWPDSVLAAMRARSVEELQQAFAEWTDRVNNYAVADTGGRFGHLYEGRIPIRGEANGWAAVPGWTGTHDWERGVIPPDELPRALDPASGWAVTCNQRVAGADYPYYVGLYMASEHRARRVVERLRELPRPAAVEDMGPIHADRLSLPAQLFVQRLRRALVGMELPGPLGEAAEALSGWEGHIDRDAVAPAVYHATRRALLRRLLVQAFGDAVELVWSASPGVDTMARLLAQEMNLGLAGAARGDELLPPGTGWDELLREAFAAGVAELSRQLGDDSAAWRWGALHRTRPTHPLSESFPAWAAWLNPPGHAVHGDGDTPLAGGFGLGSWTASVLSVNRYIFDPADWEGSRWIVPGGASGHPGSPHYADQAPLHAEVDFIPALWDFDRIAAEAESVQRLEPAVS